MWTRRDLVVLATAAAATFGLTVATFWPQWADAVDDAPAVTAEVKVPTLDLGAARVTAALDKGRERTVVLTVKNTSDEATTAQFTARAMETGPSSAMSRIGPRATQVWTDDYAIELQPGETKTLTVAIPAAAAAAQESPAQTSRPGMVPGYSYLTLEAKGQPGRAISAVSLTAAAAVVTPALTAAPAKGTL